MKILITGGAGYIGSHVVKQLLENTAYSIVVVDNLSGGSFNPLPVLEQIDKERISFAKLDLGDFEKVAQLFKKEKFDTVIHFAASIQVGESVTNPIKYYMNNTLNTTHLIYLSQKHGVTKFIFSSTAAVYGEPDVVPIPETLPTQPINPYGMSKLMSEQVLRDTAAANKDFKYVILRYFNVAGASKDVSIGESHEPETHLIPLIIHAALGKRDKIKIYGDDYDTPDGTCIRDYVHVEDLAQAHIEAIEYLKENESDIFNCGYGHGFSVLEVVECVKQISGVDFPVEVVQRRAGDPAELIADNTKIKNIMGWKPSYDDLEYICKTALEWEKKKQKEL